MPEDSSPQHDQRLAERVEQLEELLRLQTVRLHALEQRFGIDFRPPDPNAGRRAAPATDDRRREAGPSTSGTPTPARDATTPPPSTNNAAKEERFAGTPFGTWSDERASRGARAANEARASGGASARANPAGRASGGARSRSDLETLVGGTWANWAGILAVVVGVGFFLKFAFENDWVGPSGRVLLGGAAGLAIIFAGERLRLRGLRQYAFILTGGGILILYLSVYAAYAFYQLLAQLPAFLLMVGVTATAVLLSARYDALPIAVLALVGGFLTPVLLSTGRDNEIGLFSYVALLDAGVLALAYLKRWPSLNFMSFGATLMMFMGWMVIHYAPEKFWPTLFFLSLFFLLYSALTVVYNLLRRRPAGWPDLLLVIANATFYFGLGFTLLDGSGRDAWLASFALALSAFYLALCYESRRVNRGDRLLAYGFLGASVTFLTTAVAIQLEQHWITIAWAAEAAVLVWVGLRADERAARRAASAVFAVAVAHWLLNDVPAGAFREGVAFTPLLNARAASCAALVLALGVALRLYRREGARVAEDERSFVATSAPLVANLLALTLLTLDANDYFNARHAALAAVGAAVTDDFMRLEATRQFAFSVLWTLYGAALVTFGVVRRAAVLRGLGLLLLAMVAAKVVFVDALAFYDVAWRVPVFNQKFAAFALVVVALASAALAYARSGDGIRDSERRIASAALVAAANVLALVGLSVEAYGYFESRLREAQNNDGGARDLRLAQQLSLSVIWTIYGGAMLVYGRLRQNQLLRWMALALLGLTTFKVFLVDLASLDRIYKVVSFLLLGLILLAVSYLYQKSRRRAVEADQGAPVVNEHESSA